MLDAHLVAPVVSVARSSFLMIALHRPAVAGTHTSERNDLAHYQTGEYALNEAGRRWALCPWSSRKKRDKTKPPEGSYCVKDLVILEYEFASLNVMVGNFVARACGLKEPFPKSDEQPAHPLTIEQIRRQIHAGLGHPQKSSREKRLEEDEKNAAASLSIELPVAAGEQNVKDEDAKRK